jgi:O-methyltransferase
MDIHPSSPWYQPGFIEQYGGFSPREHDPEHSLMPGRAWDLVRQDMLYLLLRSVVERKVSGALAELGVYKGETARIFHHYLPEKQLFLFDTFKGFEERDIEKEQLVTGYSYSPSHFSDTSLRKVIERISPVNENVEAFAGYFPDTIPEKLFELQFCFVHLDADLFAPTYEGLKFFYPRLSKGGFILIHDYNTWAGARSAVEQFASEQGIVCVPMPDKCGSALFIKS